MATTKTTIKAIVAFKTITKNSNSSTQKRRISASDFSKSDPIYNNNNNQESSVPNDQLDSTQNKTAENDENDESDSGYNDNELTPRNKQQKTVKLKEQQKTVQLKDPSKDSKRKSSLPKQQSQPFCNQSHRVGVVLGKSTRGSFSIVIYHQPAYNNMEDLCLDLFF